jgi:hypothetical protein
MAVGSWMMRRSELYDGGLSAVEGLYIIEFNCGTFFTWGHALAQLVEALRYKSEGRGFDSRWYHWNFSLTSFRMHYGPGVDSASNRNEYQEYFQGTKTAGA